MEYVILKTAGEKDYELLDSGLGEKLERYGKFVLSRPDPQALWPKNLSEGDWAKADGIFSRADKNASWKLKKDIAEKWAVEFSGLKLWVRPTAFKHTGLFPEQAGNWDWFRKLIKESGHQISVLNLFGYTGGATLAAAAAGAEVCHVDGSKTAIGWARDNAELSGLSGKPIRWILDDAAAFVKREIKRGHKYDGIIMDPPAFGHGPKGEMWKIEDNFLSLLEDCKNVLSDKRASPTGGPLFFLINGYASGYSAVAYENNLVELVKKHGGQVEKGELTIEERSGRLLPCGIFARWRAA